MRCTIAPLPQSLWRFAGVVGLIALAIAPAAGAPSKGSLPTTFIGEAATVALAFSFPALLAGAYLGIRGMMRKIGLRGAMALGMLGIFAGFGWAVLEIRPDLLPRIAGL